MTHSGNVTRRRFLTAAAGVAAAPYVIPASALGADGRPASSNRVTLGCIGRLHTVRVGLPEGHRIGEGSRETHDPEPVPEGFDYDMWLGPAAWAPYTYNRCHCIIPAREHGDTHDTDNIQHRMSNGFRPILRQGQ
jgi:hypothetical protein